MDRIKLTQMEVSCYTDIFWHPIFWFYVGFWIFKLLSPSIVPPIQVSEEELKTCLKSLLRREDFSVPCDLPASPAKAAAFAASGAVARRSRAESREDSQDLDLVSATVAELLEKLQVKLRGEQQGGKEPSARFLQEGEIPHLQDLLTLCEDFIRWQRFVKHRKGDNPELQEPFCSFQHFPAHMRQVLQKVDFKGFEEMPEIPQQRGLAKSHEFTFKNPYFFLGGG